MQSWLGHLVSTNGAEGHLRHGFPCLGAHVGSVRSHREAIVTLQMFQFTEVTTEEGFTMGLAFCVEQGKHFGVSFDKPN